MFINISINSIFKSKWFLIIICIVVIIISLFLFKLADRYILGEKITNNNSIPFEAKSYSAEYELTVISNKTINTYYVKEWFLQDKIRYEFMDKINNTVQIIINNEKILINNANEKNNLVFNNLNFGNYIYSFSTIIKMYNCMQKKDGTCNCIMEQYKKENKIITIFKLNSGKPCTCLVCSSFSNNVNQIEIELDIKTNIPVSFRIYDKDKELISSIVYTKFELNKVIAEEMFILN